MTRARWGKRIEFFLTTVGYAVGVGDLWRFPYLVMKNGGGAFLIPIVVFYVIGAVPIVYLEMIMGQYSQSGTITVWSVCPLMKGVGYGTVIVLFLYAVYYAVMICWMLFYFLHSFLNPLPWASCDNSWNINETCVVSQFHKIHGVAESQNMTTYVNSTLSTLFDKSAMSSLANSTMTTLSSFVATNMSTNASAVVVQGIKETASEQFWYYNALKLTSGLHDLGSMNWPLVGCLAAIEIFCFFCIFKGIKLSGKVVYFTVLGPFLMLMIFLIRGALLPGADIGYKYYLIPDFERLKEPKIWAEASMQVIRSVGPGLGVMITFASYNKFSNNCMRDAILVCAMDLMTGFLGGFAVFSVLGHVSYQTGIDIRAFNQSGLGLGFIAYPEAANYLPPSQLWCALFFFMSVLLGIDSEFPVYEIVVTAIKDEFPKAFKGKTALMTFVVILAAFLMALPQVTEGGMYMVTLVDWYVGTFSVTVFALTEVIVMVYVYGMSRIEENVKEMTGRGIPILFKICFYAVTPALLTIMLVFTVLTYRPPSYNNYDYPEWAVGLGWMIAACSLIPLPIYAVYTLYKTPGSLSEKFKVNTRPTESWGPPKEVYALSKEVNNGIKDHDEML